MGILPSHIISCVPSLFHSRREEQSRHAHGLKKLMEVSADKQDPGIVYRWIRTSSCPIVIAGRGTPRIQFAISIRMIEPLSPSLVTFGGNRTSRPLSYGVLNDNFIFQFS
jgi:hypothetical protein